VLLCTVYVYIDAAAGDSPKAQRNPKLWHADSRCVCAISAMRSAMMGCAGTHTPHGHGVVWPTLAHHHGTHAQTRARITHMQATCTLTRTCKGSARPNAHTAIKHTAITPAAHQHRPRTAHRIHAGTHARITIAVYRECAFPLLPTAWVAQLTPTPRQAAPLRQPPALVSPRPPAASRRRTARRPVP